MTKICPVICEYLKKKGTARVQKPSEISEEARNGCNLILEVNIGISTGAIGIVQAGKVSYLFHMEKTFACASFLVQNADVTLCEPLGDFS